MLEHYSIDGRVMTPPIELKSILNKSFSLFIKLLGHIRLYYLMDEIWDGKSFLAFSAEDKKFIIFNLYQDAFDILINNENIINFKDEMLFNLLGQIKKIVPLKYHRPIEQLTMNFDDPTKFPCGYRCDMCLLYKNNNKVDFSASQKFNYLNWLCYCDCLPGIDIDKPFPVIDENLKWCCDGCASSLHKQECRYFYCPTQKGFKSCIECGEYDTCTTQSDGHYAAQCSLGMTAEEVTSLVIPYCMKERFNIYCNLNK